MRSRACGAEAAWFFSADVRQAPRCSVDTRRMHYDNLTLLAPFHFRPRDVRRAFELLAGRALNAGAIINARKRLGELAEVFDMLERGEVLKCAVIP